MKTTTPRPLPRNYPLSSQDRRALRDAIKRDPYWTVSPDFDGTAISRMSRAGLIDMARSIGIDARAVIGSADRD